MICDNCSKEFWRLPKRNKGKHNKYFCCRKCKDLAQRINGSCPEIRPKHYGTGNGKNNYRELVLKAKSKCAGCGTKENYLLEVHHKDGNRENNLINNLEIVCGNCHKKRHLKFQNGKWKFCLKVLTPRRMLNKI